ncbi:putative C2 and GRAM domain-containing protein-like [Capsicum annuum]|nr:putative C2 and GRAM domain-containing protein-like [Capsicum annuum]
MEAPTSFFPTTSLFNTTPLFTTALSAAATTDAAVDDIDVGPAGSNFLEEKVEASDYSTEDSVESEGELVGDDDEEEYGSNVHEEVRELRAEKRKFQRRKRNERVPADNAEVPVGEAGPDLCFDKTKTGRVSHEGSLGGDEPYFASSDEDSFVLDEDDCCGDDEHKVVDSGLGKTTNDFMIKTYIPKHTCNKTTRNYLCNAKFLVETFRERIVEQPNIRVFKLQELIRKKFKHYVGKTTVRRARSKVLKEIMGDHVVKFGIILDYKDELLRTKSGTSCVVKLGKADEASKPKFQTFYICFDALKKGWVHCRKCISLDGCFLKGICKGQLLVVVAKDGNNQMLPLAWAVVEKENTNTWTWFVRCIRDDLRLGEGGGITLITDMQKILEENINKAMDCTIKLNGVADFEVKEGLCQHTVDIVKRTCSCRLWQLKGIPCAHSVAALLFKKHPLYDYIDSYYSKQTYLRNYANVLEPLTNMEMWPISSNITVAPPEISTLPGRPSKSRKKEARETKKSEKLPRTRQTMTCRLCHVRGHNKRRCPLRGQSAEPSVAPSVTPTGSGIGRGRPEKTPSEIINPCQQQKKGRGRPEKATPVAPSAPPLLKTPFAPTVFPASCSAPSDYFALSLMAGTTKRERGNDKEKTFPLKRSKVMGMSVFQDENGFKVLNPGMPSSKICSTGQVRVTRSARITGNIGYTPSTTNKLKWNGKAAISTKKLQEIKEKKRKKNVGSSSNNSNQENTSSKSKMP